MSNTKKVINLILWLVVPFIMLPLLIYNKKGYKTGNNKTEKVILITIGIISFLIWICIIGVFAIASDTNIESQAIEAKPTEVITVIPTAKPTENPQTAYDKWVDKSFSIWDGSCFALVDLLKEHLNDADSFEHVKTTYITSDDLDTLTITMSYRAKNGFGAKVLKSCTATASKLKNEIRIIENN
jgi:hypothetical protein